MDRQSQNPKGDLRMNIWYTHSKFIKKNIKILKQFDNKYKVQI